MTIVDWNGEGRWRAEAIRSRYDEHARRFRVDAPRDLSPHTFTQGACTWICPVMEKVIDGIEHGDKACIELGIEFIQEDASFPFGLILKSKTARALRRAELSPEQQHNVRTRIVAMLLAGYVPGEFKEYGRLLRKVGLADRWPDIERGADLSNRHVRRVYEYLRRHVVGEQ